MKRQAVYTPDVRERAVRLVLTSEPEHFSRSAMTKPGVTKDQSQRMKERVCENRELKRVNEIRLLFNSDRKPTVK